MIKFAARRLWRKARATPAAYANTYLKRDAASTQAPVAKALLCRLQDNRIIRKDLNGEAKRIEDATQRQLHIVKERILRPAWFVLSGSQQSGLSGESVSHNSIFQPLGSKQRFVLKGAIICLREAFATDKKCLGIQHAKAIGRR
jgi:hypothetical protein